jgi:hypothetical protein
MVLSLTQSFGLAPEARTNGRGEGKRGDTKHTPPPSHLTGILKDLHEVSKRVSTKLTPQEKQARTAFKREFSTLDAGGVSFAVVKKL